MKRLYFGTDGVRGTFGGPVINPEFAARLAEAVARWSGLPDTVLIGRDTRASGEALLAGLAIAILGGLVPGLVRGLPPFRLARGEPLESDVESLADGVGEGRVPVAVLALDHGAEGLEDNLGPFGPPQIPVQVAVIDAVDPH
jgi:hypothetical protein